MEAKLLTAPKINPLNKDTIIEDLKRRLGAAEYQIKTLEEQWIESEKKAHEYWNKWESLIVQRDE